MVLLRLLMPRFSVEVVLEAKFSAVTPAEAAVEVATLLAQGQPCSATTSSSK